MLKFFRRFWNYLTAGANQKFNEKADPKIQLEQAITEAQEQHRLLREHAANVIAQRTKAEDKLDRKMDELEKLNANARTAVKMADDATKAGNAAKAAEYTSAAQAIATKLVVVEAEVADLRETILDATEASNQAKAAVATNGQMLQQKLAEKEKLLSQLERAKMQEQMNKAMSSLSETVGQDVPSMDEVRDKIESRYAKAKGMSELNESSVETRMMEVEAASQNLEADARLDEIRAQMGIGTSTAAAPAAEPATATEPAATEPATATEPPAEPTPSV